VVLACLIVIVVLIHVLTNVNKKLVVFLQGCSVSETVISVLDCSNNLLVMLRDDLNDSSNILANMCT